MDGLDVHAGWGSRESLHVALVAPQLVVEVGVDVARDSAARWRHPASLKPHQERQQEEHQAARTNWTDSGLVFTTAAANPLDPTNLTRRFSRLLDRAGLRRIRFHDLRHSTATLLLEQGVDLVVIQELLGHAHIGVTAGVYAHVRLRLQRQAIDSLGNALGPTDDKPTSHLPQPPSADVAVKVAVNAPRGPLSEEYRRGGLDSFYGPKYRGRFTLCRNPATALRDY